MMDICTVLKQCEDHLFPGLKMTIRERALYYHLLRHTRLEGKESGVFALLPLALQLGVSDSSVRDDVRTLHDRGGIRIVERSRLGHLIHVPLPTEIEGIVPRERPKMPVDIESLDFYTNRQYVTAILKRENERCFYCLKQIRLESCQLDHVVSRVAGTDNSYRNIVAACHECNTSKGATPAEDFLRSLYRRGTLSQLELETRLSSLEGLRTGGLVPEIQE
jgi:hypothetical protein